MKTLVATSLLALGLSIAVMSASPATAQTPVEAGREEMTIEFRYKGWDTPAENYQAVRRLVKRSCTSPGPKMMITRISENKCVTEMMDKAVSELAKPQIAQIHFAATGRRVSAGQLLASNPR